MGGTRDWRLRRRPWTGWGEKQCGGGGGGGRSVGGGAGRRDRRGGGGRGEGGGGGGGGGGRGGGWRAEGSRGLAGAGAGGWVSWRGGIGRGGAVVGGARGLSRRRSDGGAGLSTLPGKADPQTRGVRVGDRGGREGGRPTWVEGLGGGSRGEGVGRIEEINSDPPTNSPTRESNSRGEYYGRQRSKTAIVPCSSPIGRWMAVSRNLPRSLRPSDSSPPPRREGDVADRV